MREVGAEIVVQKARPISTPSPALPAVQRNLERFHASADRLAGRHEQIHAARDKKLEAVCQARRIKRIRAVA